MRSNYKKLGQFIKEVSVKNKDLSVELLLGVSITKQFIPSIANTVGTDMSKYKVVEHHQFAYGPVTSRNGEKISVALLSEEKCIVSTSYTVFEIVDTELLDPEYLMMWFRRSEFDRYARYMSHGTVRELFGWQEMCDVELPVPSIEKQREIVREYNVVNDRIALNEQLIQKLEDATQAIYKQWFVDFEFPISNEYAESIGKPELEGKPYKSSGGEMMHSDELDLEIPTYWKVDSLSSFTKNYDSKRIPLSKDIREQMPDNYRYYGAAALMGYVEDYIFDGAYVLLGEDGTVVKDNGTPVLQYVEGKFWVNNHAHVLSSDKKNISAALLYLILNNTSVIEIITGGVQAKINQKNLNALKVLLPDNNSLVQLDNDIVRIRNLIEVYGRANDTLKKFKVLLKNNMV